MTNAEATLSINFIALKKAMRTSTKTAGKVRAYYIDYINNKIDIETLFSAMKELDRQCPFIIKKNATMDEVVCDLNQTIQAASEASFASKR